MTKNVLLYLALFLLHFAILYFAGVGFSWYYYLLHVYFISLNIVLLQIYKKTRERKAFVHYYMAFSGGRMFFSLFIILAFALKNDAELVPFALSMMGLYLCYTAADSAWLYRALKKGK